MYAKNGFGYFRGEPINFEPKSGEGPPAWLLKEGAFNMQVRIRVRVRVRVRVRDRVRLGLGLGSLREPVAGLLIDGDLKEVAG